MNDDCPNCMRLRALLSPLEDKAFTRRYRENEPLEWIQTQNSTRMGHTHYRVRLADLWLQTFPGTKYSPLDLTKLGRTLQALGWSRTKIDGTLYFAIPVGDL